MRTFYKEGNCTVCITRYHAKEYLIKATRPWLQKILTKV